MKRLRGGRGLGDGLYQRPIVEHLIGRGDALTVLTDYPDIFAGTGAATLPFSKDRVDVLAHYSARKGRVGTTQWQDVCDTAQVGRLPFQTQWTVRNRSLVDGLRKFADGKPLILVHGGRVPMGRTDGFGKELLPNADAFDAVLEALRDCFLVQIGQADQIYSLAVDISLNGGTTVADLMDLGSACDGAIGQCSWIVPLAEIFDKPLLAVWAACGMSPGVHPYVQQITPRKILCKPTSRHVVDDWPASRIGEEARAFRVAIGGC